MVRRPENRAENALLRAARERLGAKPSVIARALEAYAHEGRDLKFSCSEEKYRTWEMGRVPREAVWPVLCGYFGLRPEHLGLRPAPASQTQTPCAPTTDLVSAAGLLERAHDLERRYEWTPSTALLGPAGQLLGQVMAVRRSATRARVLKALCEAEAASSILMSQLVWDASQRRDTETPLAYLDQAIHAAQQAHDPASEAYAVLRMSFIKLYSNKDPVNGRALARNAASLASPLSPALTGLSLLHLAEGYAMTRDRRACENALRRARALLGQDGCNDVAADYYSINEFNRIAGSCYLFLDLPAHAEPPLRESVSLLRGNTKAQGIALGNLTISLIRQGKQGEADETMRHALDVVESTRGGGGLNLAFGIGRELRPWRHEPWAQDINDRLLGLIAPTQDEGRT